MTLTADCYDAIITTARKEKNMNSAIALEDLKMPVVKRASGMDAGVEEEGGIFTAADVEIPDEFFNRLKCGYECVDSLMGSFVPGTTIVLSSPRGVGKTTFLTMLAEGFMKANSRLNALYVSGEEHVAQLAYTCQRVGAQSIGITNRTKVESILPLFSQYKVIIIDSLPTMTTDVEGVSKHDMELWAVQQFKKMAEKTKTVCFVILHCTKDGKSKGNSAIEHLVHATMSIHKMDPEDMGEHARLIECDKNRSGSTGSIILNMTANGYDFENPIDASKANNRNSTDGGMAGGQRAERRVREVSNLMDWIGSKPFVTESDLGTWFDLPEDPTAYDRHMRHIRSLIKMGKLVKIGTHISAVK